MSTGLLGTSAKMKCLFAALLVALGCLAGTVLTAVAQTSPAFHLGFRALAGQIPDIVGTPLEDEHHGANGDGLQQTTTGLMVWRKADNWTAFTNGSWTWINGPYGLQDRSNDGRFPWEDRGADPTPQATPVFVGQDPSEDDLVRSEAVISQVDGSHLYRCTVANINHYWSVTDLAVTLTLRDDRGNIILETQIVGKVSELGPQQQATWEYVIPPSTAYATASGTVAFRWRAPGS